MKRKTPGARPVEHYKLEIAKKAGDYSTFSILYHTLDEVLSNEPNTEKLRCRVRDITVQLISIAQKQGDPILSEALRSLRKKYEAKISLFQKIDLLPAKS